MHLRKLNKNITVLKHKTSDEHHRSLSAERIRLYKIENKRKDLLRKRQRMRPNQQDFSNTN